ncbi:MAG: hypothetical protein ACI8W8_004126 [Rhodothermales bacterium]|jgi:hypothetical protein
MKAHSKLGGKLSCLEWACIGIILGIGLLIVAPWIIPLGYGSRDAKTYAEIKHLELALEQYNQEWGYYLPAARAIPCSSDWLDSLVSRAGRPSVDMSFLRVEDGFLVDAYGNPIRFQSPGVYNPERFDIWSSGKNGKFEPGD